MNTNITKEKQQTQDEIMHGIAEKMQGIDLLSILMQKMQELELQIQNLKQYVQLNVNNTKTTYVN